MVRVRFAPSPTGYFHVGSARTALFNWLFARHYHGTFILRIEDTDRERSTDESIDQIIESMTWLGLDWDERYRQTDLTPDHLQAAEQLMENGQAYELDGAWWFKVPADGETVVHDSVMGDVTFRHEEFKDFVIRRSDETFVYNFVVVVDDSNMKVTHVIRGDDHLINTPKQVLLYQALERPLPQFAHLPLILGEDRARLSKRHGASSVLEYRQMGFVPEGLINFLARLGWSHGDDELFDRDELIRLFTLEEINRSAAVFNHEKLYWTNQQHMKRLDLEGLAGLVRPFAVAEQSATAEQWDAIDRDRLHLGVDLLRDRSKTLVDLAKVLEILFAATLEPEEPIVLEDRQRVLVAAVADALAEANACEFTPDAVHDIVQSVLAANDAKLKEIAKAVRLCITGRKVGPGLFEIMSAAGQDLSVGRLRALVR
ncbi:glutamate--tRNA ligase [Candidatus Bipolaricaulota bacterium]|nr:glutamate--tRNA ligase [Candidatus Bipolaricaulota bacterium]